MEWQWFTAVIGVPVIGGLVAWTVRLQTRQTASVADLHQRISVIKDDLSGFKTETAKIYVTKNDMLIVERRIADRLDIIDRKIDRILNGRRFCGPASPK